MNNQDYLKYKRIFDVIISFILILLFTPIFLFISVLIYISMGFPILFSQKRAGKDNKSFIIFKFRTMRQKADKYRSDSERITWVGHLLRLFRLDELPQLFNILLGDMSFIGPRPLLPEYLPYYTKEEILRHDVRPGLSGYSQIKSLNYPKWEEQFSNDIHYVKNISFRLDFIILLKTMERIIKPSSMLATGVSEGRPNFDIYRKQQIQQNPQMRALLSGSITAGYN